MIIIGLTGEKAGGKGTFVTLLCEAAPDKKIVRMGFGDIIGEICDILGKPRTRENMQKIPIALIKEFGESDIITQAMRKRVAALSQGECDILILDGIRRWEDYEYLRSFPANHLVYVTASRWTRFNRARKRNEKVGEAQLTMEQFIAQDQAEIELLVPEIGKKADFRIDNEQPIDYYRMRVEEISDVI
ncbi:MAG: hypothetical protein KGI60_02030 [Patescibacteria group bacterium]|nr:hypothetical protein [Patescibacteria group bacterium]